MAQSELKKFTIGDNTPINRPGQITTPVDGLRFGQTTEKYNLDY